MSAKLLACRDTRPAFAVVLANARTHNHRLWFLRMVVDPARSKRSACGYGSRICVRRRSRGGQKARSSRRLSQQLAASPGEAGALEALDFCQRVQPRAKIVDRRLRDGA